MYSGVSSWNDKRIGWASHSSAGGTNRGNLRGLGLFLLCEIRLAHSCFSKVYTNTRLASLLAGLSASVYAAAYVQLGDMATALKAKHINCRLTPQKQHDLIPLRICKKRAIRMHALKSHSEITER